MKGILYLFGAISTVFRYVVFPYVYIFCGKEDGKALVKNPFRLSILFASPYMFIILFGYYSFYSNLGAFAILGSDCYSYTLVPALMIWFGKESKSIDKWIFSRDYGFALLQLYFLRSLLA